MIFLLGQEDTVISRLQLLPVPAPSCGCQCLATARDVPEAWAFSSEMHPHVAGLKPQGWTNSRGYRLPSSVTVRGGTAFPWKTWHSV